MYHKSPLSKARLCVTQQQGPLEASHNHFAGLNWEGFTHFTTIVNQTGSVKTSGSLGSVWASNLFWLFQICLKGRVWTKALNLPVSFQTNLQVGLWSQQ